MSPVAWPCNVCTAVCTAHLRGDSHFHPHSPIAWVRLREEKQCAGLSPRVRGSFVLYYFSFSLKISKIQENS